MPPSNAGLLCNGRRCVVSRWFSGIVLGRARGFGVFVTRSTIPVRIHSQNQCRSFISTSVYRQEASKVDEKGHEQESLKDEARFYGNLSKTNTTPATIPWYLQVERPRVISSSPLAERQKIPELPPNPPPILEPLLQQLSVELGLEDLVLLDLRMLYPPPALGANLLMIIGTGRSIKHLNVSADVFCRWLRSDYGLRPYADGLLGKNELKLKLKRKARRAKRLRSVGAPVDNNQDDGIHTGWICVNLGRVQGGVVVEDAHEDEEFVGFRSGKQGAHVVVQMLTEEKRAELDLEGLWTGFLNRFIAKNEKQKPKRKDEEQQSSVMNTDLPSQFGLLSRDSSNVNGFIQKRSYHASSPRSKKKFSRVTFTDQDEDPERQAWLEKQMAEELEAYENHLEWNYILSQPLDESELPSHKSSEEFLTADETENLSDVQILSALNRRLKGLHPSRAIEALGDNFKDYSSTPFLRQFYKHVPEFRTTEHWEQRIALLCYGIELGHPGYKKANLDRVFGKLRSSLVPISDATFSNIITTYLSMPKVPEESVQAEMIKNVNKSINLAISVIGEMFYRGQNALTTEHFLRLHELALHMPSATSKRRLCQTLKSLTTLLSVYRIPISTPSAQIRLLSVYATAEDWPGFWRVWNTLSVSFPAVSRGTEVYEYVFKTSANMGRQTESLKTLRSQIEEMGKEPVPLVLEKEPAIAVQVCRCIFVAAGGAAAMRDIARKAFEWSDGVADDGDALLVPIYGRCVEALGLERTREVMKQMESTEVQE